MLCVGMDSPEGVLASAKECGRQSQCDPEVRRRAGHGAVCSSAANASLWRFRDFSVESPLMSEQNNKSEEQPKLDDLISLSEAAELSGLSQSHLRLLVRRGEIWGKRMGRDWFTSVQAVQEYVARERKPGPKSTKKAG